MAIIERYVDTSAAVTGDGSAGAPWQTLAEAFPSTLPGFLAAGYQGIGADIDAVLAYTAGVRDPAVPDPSPVAGREY